MQEIIKNLDLHFQGVWICVVISVILFLLSLIIPKRNITWKEQYITFGIVGVATWICDAILFRVIDLLDLGHPTKTGLGDILAYTFIPTSLAILFLNFLTENNKWKLSLLFSFISSLIEITLYLSGYLQTKSWSIPISFILFIFVYRFILPLHLKIIRR
ncbi:hypothetical protein [Sutcliffiella rhizosphaerae]|uniref:Uncharacterized protein n=1 Tax=Sutcliffiella rhizosphaerae TaxID=2880967 RepID=A0ABM8YPB2_9BACI|nr:hypothetical protein [Sutcliffiella rhizosphaerae]CAG9621839.1 hypothetical protein BACCIP111883_02630 [Sutcliffiella rhizosphaerae]